MAAWADATNTTNTTTICWIGNQMDVGGARVSINKFGHVFYLEMPAAGVSFELETVKITKGSLPSISIPLHRTTPRRLHSVALAPIREYARRRC